MVFSHIVVYIVSNTVLETMVFSHIFIESPSRVRNKFGFVERQQFVGGKVPNSIFPRLKVPAYDLYLDLQ